jgi:hypothetical protein
MTQDDNPNQRLLRPHRLVAELRTAATAAEEDKGVLRLNFEKVLRVRTSAKHLRRVLLLMDTLIKLLEANGGTVRIGTKYTETELVLADGALSFRLDERTTRVTLQRPEGKSRDDHWYPRSEMRATGEFSLEFGKFVLAGSPHVWRDKRDCPLESQFHEIVDALPSWNAILRERRLENERQAAASRDSEARRKAAAREREILRRQRAALVGNVEAWERAERIRGYVSAVERQYGDDAKTWASWALDQANALDPLPADSSVITLLDVQLESYFTGPNPWDKTSTDWWGG